MKEEDPDSSIFTISIKTNFCARFELVWRRRIGQEEKWNVARTSKSLPHLFTLLSSNFKMKATLLFSMLYVKQQNYLYVSYDTNFNLSCLVWIDLKSNQSHRFICNRSMNSAKYFRFFLVFKKSQQYWSQFDQLLFSTFIDFNQCVL